MNKLLYGAKVVGDRHIVYVSSELEDVVEYIGGSIEFVIVRFNVEVNDYQVV